MYVYYYTVKFLYVCVRIYDNAFKEDSGDGGDALGGTIEKINIMNLADGQPSKE